MPEEPKVGKFAPSSRTDLNVAPRPLKRGLNSLVAGAIGHQVILNNLDLVKFKEVCSSFNTESNEVIIKIKF
jgi:hypothetical protein